MRKLTNAEMRKLRNSEMRKLDFGSLEAIANSPEPSEGKSHAPDSILKVSRLLEFIKWFNF